MSDAHTRTHLAVRVHKMHARTYHIPSSFTQCELSSHRMRRTIATRRDAATRNKFIKKKQRIALGTHAHFRKVYS